MARETGPRAAGFLGFLAIAAFLVCLPCGGDALSTMPKEEPTKEIVGRVELARICPEGILLRAKMDTGATNSSIHAERIVDFTKDGQPWVRFQVTSGSGKRSTIERRVVRIAKIKQHGGENLRRPVVLLTLCVGRVCREAEVNLQDRSEFLYPLLIGRSYMRGCIVVDPDLNNSTKPVCKENPPR